MDKDVMVNMIENMSDGMLVIGFDGKVRLENSNAASILGIPVESMCGRGVAELMVQGDENDEFFQCIVDAIFYKKRISDTVKYHKDGQRKYLHLVVSPLKDEGHHIALSVLFSDMTDLVELERRNRLLNRKLMQFMDNFVKMMIGAIEARTPYNATHTKKMAEYMENFMSWRKSVGRPFDDEIKLPLLASVWLHDIGKLVIPTEIMDKPTRLGASEKDVFHRIELARVCEELRMARDPEVADDANAMIEKLDAAKELIEKVNKQGFIDDKDKGAINEYAKLLCLNSVGEKIPLLNDYELEALTVPGGTLTKDERLVMQSHVIRSREMLTELGFEDKFSAIPEWAGDHHEYLDGTGYPKGLKGDEISKESRLITIIDIYDALTAEDRPYKKPCTPEQAFEILRNMGKEGKLDEELLEEFYESGAWK